MIYDHDTEEYCLKMRVNFTLVLLCIAAASLSYWF